MPNNVSVTVTVTPPAPGSTQYTWSYAIGTGGSQTLELGSQFASMTRGSATNITITLQSSVSTDEVVFQSSTQTLPSQQGPPLTFCTWDNETIENPEWYPSSPPAGGNASISFTDNSPNAHKRTYYFYINAVYIPLGSTATTGTLITSPDPTIVNSSTSGPPYGPFSALPRTAEV